jgi:hypothetical protein
MNNTLERYFVSLDPCLVEQVFYLFEEGEYDEQSVREIFNYQSSRTGDLFRERHEIDYFRHVFMLCAITIFIDVDGSELFLTPLLKSVGTDTFDAQFHSIFDVVLPNIFKLYNLENIPCDESVDYSDTIRTSMAFLGVYAATHLKDVNAINKVFEHFDFLIIEPAFPSNIKGAVKELGLGLLRSRYELGRGKMFFTKEIVESHFDALMKEDIVDYRFFLAYYRWDADDEEDDIFNEDYDTLELMYTDPEFSDLIKHEYIDKYIRVKMQKYIPWYLIHILSTTQLVGLYVKYAKSIRVEFACHPNSFKTRILRWFLSRSRKSLHTIRWLEK